MGPRTSAQTPAGIDLQLYAELTITGAIGTVYSVEYVTDLAQSAIRPWSPWSITQGAAADAVLAWGSDFYSRTPVPIAAQSGVIAIAVGDHHIVALRNDGTVVAWGWGNNGQSAVPSNLSGVTSIAAGDYHTLALKNDGSVVAWGNNNYGQVIEPRTTRGPYSAVASPVTFRGQKLNDVKAIAAGGYHTVALKNDGSVVAWGAHGDSLLGWPQYGQTDVPDAAQSGVMAIAAGGYHTVALRNDGSVLAWGEIQTEVPETAKNGVIAIAAGSFHTVALKNDGSVLVWGENSNGQTEVPEAAKSGVIAIAAGGNHTVALKNDGSIVSWGNDGVGQLAVPDAAQSGVGAIAAGRSNVAALVIPTAPTIISPPGSQAVRVWQSAGFAVTTAGYPLNYQWRKDGVDVIGATNATFILPLARA